MMNTLNNGTREPSIKPLYSKCIWFDYCPIPEFVETGKLPEKWTLCFCNVANPYCKRYQLENMGRNIPDNMLPDGTIEKNLQRFDD